MAKKAKLEDIIDVTNDEMGLTEVPKNTNNYIENRVTRLGNREEGLVNCLRNERIVIKHINKPKGNITDPKHVLFGGMSENAKKVYTVPLQRSGALTDVLTKDEKNYLEYALGLEPNALSVYNKDNNFWDTTNDQGISKVTLYKHDNYLDLSNPSDYIKYKILLANKDRIAPSIAALQDYPKATYEFVIISEEDTNKDIKTNMSTKMLCYKEFGKIEDNADVLSMIIEIMDGRPTSPDTKIEFLQNKVNDLIQADGKLFLKIVQDKLLPNKILIRKAIREGIIAKRGDYLYLRSDNTPLCNNDQEPTFNIAAAFLAEPKHQELKFSIEAKLKE